MTSGPVREDNQAVASVRVAKGGELAGVESLRDKLKAEGDLVIVFGDSVQGDALRKLVAFGDSLGIPVKYVCLVDYSNSRGAFDMGLIPRDGGMCREQMLAATDLDVLWVVGANPLKSAALASKNAFVVVQDLFMTETAKQADIVLPAASAYEKNGTVTNVCGEVQKLKQAVKVMGTKTDLEIFGHDRQGDGAESGHLAAGQSVRRDPQDRAWLRRAAAGARDGWGSGTNAAAERSRGRAAGRDPIRRRHAVHLRLA